MKILAIDPGITTGWCLVEGPFKGQEPWWTLHDFGSFKLPGTKKGKRTVFDITAFSAWMDSYYGTTLGAVVVEDFIMRPNFREQNWTTLETAKLVGMAVDRAYTIGVHCEVQQPSCKDTGSKLSKMHRKSDSDPNRHWLDAVSHGVYYLHQKRYSGGPKKR